MSVLAKPYTLKEAAEAIGLSRDWLRARLRERIDLQAIAFKTRGKTGHIRFDPVAFAVWWNGYQEAGAMAKPQRQRRKRRSSRPAGYSPNTSGAADCLAVLRGA